jgi:Nucleoside-diphosphate-sugar epimerases
LRVFVLGGTGLIGTAVVRELVGRGHQLFGLARSGTSAARLDHIGVTSFPGDIRSPEPWVARLPSLDAVIHMACDFTTDMGAIDRHLLDRLLPALAAQKGTTAFHLYRRLLAVRRHRRRDRHRGCAVPSATRLCLDWCRSFTACWPRPGSRHRHPSRHGLRR